MAKERLYSAIEGAHMTRLTMSSFQDQGQQARDQRAEGRHEGLLYKSATAGHLRRQSLKESQGTSCQESQGEESYYSTG